MPRHRMSQGAPVPDRTDASVRTLGGQPAHTPSRGRSDQEAVIVYGIHSDIGQRDSQEDRALVVDFRTADGQVATLALIADGIGGGTTGERASYLAQEIIPALLQSHTPAASEIPAALVEAFSETNRRIHAEATTDSRRAGMGTTCTAVAIVSQRLYLAHVGDSRAYLIRGNTIQQLSIDHTWVESALQAGRPAEQLRNHPNRHVIERYLGIDPDMPIDTRYRPVGSGHGLTFVDSAVQPLHLQRGDSILLCTDGVSDSLEDVQLLRLVRSRRPEQAARAVVHQALQASLRQSRLEPGHRADNTTALVLDLPGATKVLALPRWLPWAAGAATLLLAAGGAGAWFVQHGFPGPDHGSPLPASTAAWVVAAETPGSQDTPGSLPLAEATATLLATHTPVPPTATATTTVAKATETLQPAATQSSGSGGSSEGGGGAPTATKAPTAQPSVTGAPTAPPTGALTPTTALPTEPATDSPPPTTVPTKPTKCRPPQCTKTPK
jgi:serine/threonine protein phosphatase PrpC